MSVTEQVIQKVKKLSENEARDLLAHILKNERDEVEEDRRDVESARRALAEADKEGWIPWEQVKAELGLNSISKKKKSQRAFKALKH